ncbi:MAG: hypothetical protein V4557_12280 [Bacteroidota bacterium]
MLTKTAVVIAQQSFPSSIQFLPKNGREQTVSTDTITMQHKAVDDMIAHGFNTIWVRNFSGAKAKDVIHYAQSKGMKVDFMTNGFELFNRYDTASVSVYSPKYAAAVKKQMDSGLAQLKEINQLYTVFPFQDEPFHGGPKSFDYSVYAQAEFLKRYQYPMPDSLETVKNDPKKWIDLLNFQSNTFRDGWFKVYNITKKFDPRAKIAMTHDSHNSFGAGVKSNSKIAIDDVFYWGGSFADVFVYDIYPYHTFDYRYGELGKLPKPRISQMHYAISQLRNVTTTYKKELGFWVGTYNEAWFTRFRGEERQKQYWAESELAYTAIAQGSNYLISPSNFTDTNIPMEESHWKDYGKSMTVIQKAGPGLLTAPKVKANACFLFPRTQYLLLQEEYFNVGLSFELFLRSFGELDILHEDQVTDDELNDYKILVLGDVKLLPQKVADRIESFVRKGGIVIADCLPQMDVYKQPLNSMKKLFGVSKAETKRVVQEGQWVPFTMLPPKMSFPPDEGQVNPPVRTDAIDANGFGNAYQFKVISPHAMEITDAKVLLAMKSGLPAVISKDLGKGKSYLFGFSLQDTYFQTYKDSSETSREQLRSLLTKVLADAQVPSHIHSSNPDIEATIRANKKEGYIFIINHESNTAETRVQIAGLEFQPAEIVDVENETPVSFTQKNGTTEFIITAPFGTTRLLKVLPGKSRIGK